METSGGKEAAMWKMAKRLFSEYPYSDGKDKRYVDVVKSLYDRESMMTATTRARSDR